MVWGARERERLRERDVGTNPTNNLSKTWTNLDSDAHADDKADETIVDDILC